VQGWQWHRHRVESPQVVAVDGRVKLVVVTTTQRRLDRLNERIEPMGYPEAEQNPNFPQIEKEIIERWLEDQTFDPTLGL
jgi:hypothetical protein